MPILRAHRSLDRTLYPIRQAQLEQIWLATLLRLPHDRLAAPTGVAAQQCGPFRRRKPVQQAPQARSRMLRRMIAGLHFHRQDQTQIGEHVTVIAVRRPRPGLCGL